MSEITTIFNKGTGLLDYSEPFVYRYPETEDLGGHIFRHIHCREEKEKQVLVPEAYELFQKCSRNM